MRSCVRPSITSVYKPAGTGCCGRVFKQCCTIPLSCSFARDFWHRIVLLAVVCGLPIPAYAQQSGIETPTSSTSDAATLDELQFIGRLEDTPLTGEVVNEEHTGSVSRISRQRLEQPGAQLGELLSRTSGVQQRQSGGFGTFSNITVRAASASQTAVYLDGILLNTGGESVIDMSTLEVLNLGSIDIYKGSAPLQLGHASMGGAVNLNTLRSGDDDSAQIQLGAGSFEYASFLAAYQARNGKWDWTTTVSRRQSDNDFSFINNNATPLNPFDDKRQQRVNNQVRRSAMLLKGGYQRTDSSRTELLLQLAKRNVGVPNARNSAGNTTHYETQKTQIQLAHIVDQWSGWNTRHSLYWHGSDSIYDDSDSQVGLGAQYIDSDIRTLGAKTYWERFLNIGTLGFSVDARDEQLDLSDDLNTDENFTADRQLLLATAHLAIADEYDRWLITPAVRWQSSQRRGTSSSLGVPADIPDQNESQLSAQLGFAYSITPSIRFKANAGNYFREPTFNELFGSIGLINGNPGLEPEDGVNTDIGISYDTENLTFSIAVYNNRHDNLILNSFDARGIGRPRNTGKADISGIELSADWMLTSKWKIAASATFQNPRNKDPFRGFQNKILPGESRRAGFTQISYQHHKVRYWYEWQITQDRFYDSSNLLPAVDTSVQNLGLAFKHHRWDLSVSLQNISDDNVEDYNGFPKPGRSFFTTLSYQL